EDSNEAAFAVAEAEKIYAHESLTFNNTVACDVIFKWNVGLKDNMDARSDVYVLSNGCRRCGDDSDGYYWEYTSDDITSKVLYRNMGFNESEECKKTFIGSGVESLKGNFQHMEALSTTKAGYMTNGIATGALVKGGSRSEVPAQVEVDTYRSHALIQLIRSPIESPK
nr:zinc finger, CCHC-type [Tanacetum cinerariifolium]